MILESEVKFSQCRPRRLLFEEGLSLNMPGAEERFGIKDAMRENGAYQVHGKERHQEGALMLK